MRHMLAFVCILGLTVLTAPAPAAEPAAPVAVGVARVDITPDGPIRLSGYSSRKTESEGVEQKLYTRALAIGDDAAGPVVLVTVENCGVPARVTEEVAARLKAKAQLPRERFVVASTHVHSGPVLTGALTMMFGPPLPADQQERVDRYTNGLIDKMEQVALAALADRRPGRLAWGKGQATFAINRRAMKDGRCTGLGINPDGPVLHEMPMLRVVDTDDHVRAVLIGYACHCTTLGGDFNKICGDWAGYASETIEREHPGSVALVALGCGGDANPNPRGKLEQAQSYGEAIAREVNRLLTSSLEPVPGTIVARFRRIELPFGPLPTRAEWVEKAKKPGIPGYHAQFFLEKLDRGETIPTEIPYPVQTLCFGNDLAMVFLGGEVVVDYALRLRNELDPARLWVSAYSNDVPCYIVSKRLLKEGGYEVDDSMVYYARPTRLAPEAEDRVIATVHDLLPSRFEKSRSVEGGNP